MRYLQSKKCISTSRRGRESPSAWGSGTCQSCGPHSWGNVYYSSVHPHYQYKDCYCGTTTNLGVLPGAYPGCGYCTTINVDLLVQYDTAYMQTYAQLYSGTMYSYHYEMTSTIANMEQTFRNKWGLVFNKTYRYVTGLPLDNCPRGTEIICGIPVGASTFCGTCDNAYNSASHHRNFYSNYYFVRDNFPLNGADLMLTVSGALMCDMSGGSHRGGLNGGTLGLGETSGKYSMVKNNPTSGMILNVRRIQHELSHNYGNNHCSGNECIMNSGWDYNWNYNVQTIWCIGCEQSFNANLH